MKKAAFLFVLFSILFLGFSEEIEAQCAMCKAVLESNMQSGEEAKGKGVNAGIKYIMAMPYLVLGVAGYFTYKHHKKNKKDQ